MNFLFKILKGLKSIHMMIVVFMPGELGNYLRYHYYKKRLKKCGKNVTIEFGVDIIGAEFISIGDNVVIDKYTLIKAGKVDYVNVSTKVNSFYSSSDNQFIIGNNFHICPFCILYSYGGMSIADKVVISSGSKLYSMTNTPYSFSTPSKVISLMPYEQAEYLIGAISLQENVWVGLNVIIMPGCNIGKNSFIMSNAVITESVGENSYVTNGYRKSKKQFRFEFSE